MRLLILFFFVICLDFTCYAYQDTANYDEPNDTTKFATWSVRIRDVNEHLARMDITDSVNNQHTGEMSFDKTNRLLKQWNGSSWVDFTLNFTGSVGIGTVAPTYKLHLHEPTAATAVYYQITNNATGPLGTDGTQMGLNATGDFSIWNVEATELRLYTSNAQRLTIQADGDVGIGTTTPDATFEVEGEVQFDAGLFIFNEDSGDYDFRVEGNGNTHLIFGDAGSDRVGIKTSGPEGTLHSMTATAGTVTAHADADDMIIENSGNGGLSMLVPDANNSNLFFGSPTDNAGAKAQWNYDLALMTIGTLLSSGELQLVSADGSNAMRIDSSGNVGIGTTNPTCEIHYKSTEVSGLLVDPSTKLLLEDSSEDVDIVLATDSAGQSKIIFEDGANTEPGSFIYNHSNNSLTLRVDETNVMTIDQFSQVVINDGSTLKELDVNGTIECNGLLIAALDDESQTPLEWDGSKVVQDTSALKYKKDIVNIHSEINTENIYNLQGVVYTRKSSKTGAREIGIVADHAFEIIPELVVVQKGEIESFRYSRLSVLMLEEMKVLKKENIQLRKGLAALIRKVEKLEDK